MPYVKPPTNPESIVHRPSRIDGAKCYHADDNFMRCVSWLYGTKVTLAEAQKQGLRPCRRCFAYQPPPRDEG